MYIWMILRFEHIHRLCQWKLGKFRVFFKMLNKHHDCNTFRCKRGKKERTCPKWQMIQQIKIKLVTNNIWIFSLDTLTHFNPKYKLYKKEHYLVLLDCASHFSKVFVFILNANQMHTHTMNKCLHSCHYFFLASHEWQRMPTWMFKNSC